MLIFCGWSGAGWIFSFGLTSGGKINECGFLSSNSS
jgi:hypothetical protein